MLKLAAIQALGFRQGIKMKESLACLSPNRLPPRLTPASWLECERSCMLIALRHIRARIQEMLILCPLRRPIAIYRPVLVHLRAWAEAAQTEQAWDNTAQAAAENGSNYDGGQRALA
jgi:hypothetical protein